MTEKRQRQTRDKWNWVRSMRVLCYCFGCKQCKSRLHASTWYSQLAACSWQVILQPDRQYTDDQRRMHDIQIWWKDPWFEVDSQTWFFFLLVWSRNKERFNKKKKNIKSIELHINVDNIIVYFGHDLWSKARCKLYANASSLHHL